MAVCDVNRGFPVGPGNNVAKVTSMPVIIVRASVFLTLRVEVRACADTTIRVVTKLMDVKAMFALLQPDNFPCHHSWAIFLHNKEGGEHVNHVSR